MYVAEIGTVSDKLGWLVLYTLLSISEECQEEHLYPSSLEAVTLALLGIVIRKQEPVTVWHFVARGEPHLQAALGSQY